MTPKTPTPVPPGLLAYFEGTSVLDLEAKADEKGRPHYPFTLKRKSASSRGLHEEPCMLRTLTLLERTRAVVTACKIAGKLAGRSVAENVVPLTVPQAIDAVGEESFVNLENLAVAALCIREVAPPFDQKSDAESLGAVYTAHTIRDALDQLDTLAKHEDFRVPEPLAEDVFRKLVDAIARAGDISPLGGIAGDARINFIVSMGCRLAPFLTSKSSVPSSAISTPPTP
jgi:hypothetical protein